MRVAITSPALRLGGLEKYSQTLGRQLKSNGHHVDFVETRWCGAWSSWFRDSGYSVCSLPLPAHRSSVAHAMHVAHELSRSDVVIVNDDAIARAGFGILPSATSTIAVIHTNLPSQFQTAIGSTADLDALVGVSDAIVERVRCDLAGRSPLLVRVHPGVEVPSQWPKKGVASSGPLRMCFVGRISDWDKGVFLLPPILRSVLTAGIDARLVIGGDGPDLAGLRARFAETEADSRVGFPGALAASDALKLLEESDVLLLPSRLEGFPLVPLEAMARGTVPVVTLLPGSTDRMITDGVHGRLVASGDVAGFAEAIVDLARNRDKLREMSEAGWRRVREEFGEERMGAEFLKLIEEVRSRPGRRSGQIDRSVLGDFPSLPSGLVRPARKLSRILKRLSSRVSGATR